MHVSSPLLRVNLSSIRNNYRTLKSLTKAEVAAVVKANCYGLGIQIVKTLFDESCKHFFVSCATEGGEVREYLKDVNTYVLNGAFEDTCDYLVQNNLIPVINSSWQLLLWIKHAKKISVKLRYILHVNTGLNRLGVNFDEIEEVSDICKANVDSCTLLYLISHLACADNKFDSKNKEQITTFNNISKYFPGIKRSLVSSSGIFLGNEYHYDLVRPGAAICGFSRGEYKFENPITITTSIIHLQTLDAGQSVGYEKSYITSRKSVIATVPLGYADGFINALRKYGKVSIDGVKINIVGRASMDLITIDVTDIKDIVFIGKEVEVMGNNSIRPDELAYFCNLAGYEILTLLGNRYKRVYNFDEDKSDI